MNSVKYHNGQKKHYICWGLGQRRLWIWDGWVDQFNLPLFLLKWVSSHAAFWLSVFSQCEANRHNDNTFVHSFPFFFFRSGYLASMELAPSSRVSLGLRGRGVLCRVKKEEKVPGKFPRLHHQLHKRPDDDPLEDSRYCTDRCTLSQGERQLCCKFTEWNFGKKLVFKYCLFSVLSH